MFIKKNLKKTISVFLMMTLSLTMLSACGTTKTEKTEITGTSGAEVTNDENKAQGIITFTEQVYLDDNGNKVEYKYNTYAFTPDNMTQTIKDKSYTYEYKGTTLTLNTEKVKKDITNEMSTYTTAYILENQGNIYSLIQDNQNVVLSKITDEKILMVDRKDNSTIDNVKAQENKLCITIDTDGVKTQYYISADILKEIKKE